MDNQMTPRGEQTESVSTSPAARASKPSIFIGASPRLTFIMGLLVGVAGVSLIGFVLAASFAFSSKSPLAGSGSNVAQAPTAPAPTGQTAPSPVDIAIKETDYVRGNADAPVTIVEYSDLECPYCKSFHPSMIRLMNEYSNQVRWIYRHFPLSFHVNAQKEAEAAECAGKLGGNEKFWAYIDKIFERTTSNGTGFALDALAPLAKELGLNEARFKTCLDGGEFAAHVQQDLQEGADFGVNGTPTTFVNGQPVEGAVPYEQLKAVVES